MIATMVVTLYLISLEFSEFIDYPFGILQVTRFMWSSLVLLALALIISLMLVVKRADWSIWRLSHHALLTITFSVTAAFSIYWGLAFGAF